MISLLSGDHLGKAGKGYASHLRFAMSASGLLFAAAIASLVHGLVPRLFPFTSAKIVLRLAEKVRSSHSYEHLH
jgi:hypothetical protein